LDTGFLSRLFYYSLALSAWKQVTGPDRSARARWSLRVNPSSGNLHPTEAYLVCGPAGGLSERPAVYHYAPFEHGLELLRKLEAGPPPETVLLGLTSIHWRESWKYGERAFRYCQHDLGHAIAAVAIAAAGLGWSPRLDDCVTTRQLSALLGLDRQHGIEAEHPGCLLVLSAGSRPPSVSSLLAGLRGSAWRGNPNRLSREHHDWPVIDEIAAGTENPGLAHQFEPESQVRIGLRAAELPAWQIIRQRRSAVALDGTTWIGRETFFRILRRIVPSAAPVPFETLPWKPCVSLVLFVHRVEGVPAGLYALVRHPSHEESLRRSLRSDFQWQRAEGCPEELGLYLLLPGDTRHAAKTICCHQEIASDGVFSVAMLAALDAALEAGGMAMYPRMFWETGVIGQVLYLEAEAAGIRATGIGCFFDDACHDLLGIRGHAWQSLYHFTMGGPLEDPRLQTLDAYHHLQ
jgi:SagB-type dehydrogenase family enzyme